MNVCKGDGYKVKINTNIKHKSKYLRLKEKYEQKGKKNFPQLNNKKSH